jgi:hypothetical protein
MNAIKSCAKLAGLSWNGTSGLASCVAGSEAFNIMHDPSYAVNVIVAMRRFRKAKFHAPPGMPWIFMDGELLKCGGSECTAIQTPEGDRPLKQPGSLLFLVCSRLDPPMPDICQDVHQPGRHRKEDQQVTRCETCVEVGVFRFDNNRRVVQLSFHVLAFTGGMVFALIFGVVWLRRGPRCWISGSIWQKTDALRLHIQAAQDRIRANDLIMIGGDGMVCPFEKAPSEQSSDAQSSDESPTSSRRYL